MTEVGFSVESREMVWVAFLAGPCKRVVIEPAVVACGLHGDADTLTVAQMEGSSGRSSPLS